MNASITVENIDGKTALNFCEDSIKQQPKSQNKPAKGSLLDKLLAAKDALTKGAAK